MAQDTKAGRITVLPEPFREARNATLPSMFPAAPFNMVDSQKFETILLTARTDIRPVAVIRYSGQPIFTSFLAMVAPTLFLICRAPRFINRLAPFNVFRLLAVAPSVRQFFLVMRVVSLLSPLQFALPVFDIIRHIDDIGACLTGSSPAIPGFKLVEVGERLRNAALRTRLFCYSLIGQGANLLNRFTFWLKPRGCYQHLCGLPIVTQYGY